MKMTEFLALLDRAEAIAARLAGGLAADEFDRAAGELEEVVTELAIYTKPRGGGVLEADLGPYATEGGAPAFLADLAHRLLAVATVLRRARELRWDLVGATWQPPDSTRADLRYAARPSISYSAADVEKVRKVIRFLYSRRAYELARTGKILVDAVRDGTLPGDMTIAGLSKWNLSNLRKALGRLTAPERDVYEALRSLPYTLKHTTSAAAWGNIANVGMLWSKVSLADWNVLEFESGFTTRTDVREKQDVDFMFFRLEADRNPIDTRYGDFQVVFDIGQVLEDGWVTLHDMLKPIASQTLQCLKLGRADTVVRRSSYIDAVTRHQWRQIRWQHEIVDPRGKVGQKRIVHILHEVFYGPDIIEGIVLSMLRDLRELPTLLDEVLANLGDEDYLRWLFGAMFRVEAKYPSAFRFEAGEILATHRKPAVMPGALKAATGT